MRKQSTVQLMNSLFFENEEMLRLIYALGQGVMFQSQVQKFMEYRLSPTTIKENVLKLKEHNLIERKEYHGNFLLFLKRFTILKLLKKGNDERAEHIRNTETAYSKTAMISEIILRKFREAFEEEKLREFLALTHEQQTDYLFRIEENRIIEEMKKKLKNTTEGKEFTKLPRDRRVKYMLNKELYDSFKAYEKVQKELEQFLAMSKDEQRKFLTDYKFQGWKRDNSTFLLLFLSRMQRETNLLKKKDEKLIKNYIRSFTNAKGYNYSNLSEEKKEEVLRDLELIISRFNKETKYQELKEQLIQTKMPKAKKGEEVTPEMVQQVQDRKIELAQQIKNMRLATPRRKTYYDAFGNKQTDTVYQELSLANMRQSSIYIEDISFDANKLQVNLQLALCDFGNSFYAENLTEKIEDSFHFFNSFFGMSVNESTIISGLKLKVKYNVYLHEERKLNIFRDEDNLDYIIKTLERKRLPVRLQDIKFVNLNLLATVFNNVRM